MRALETLEKNRLQDSENFESRLCEMQKLLDKMNLKTEELQNQNHLFSQSVAGALADSVKNIQSEITNTAKIAISEVKKDMITQNQHNLATNLEEVKKEQASYLKTMKVYHAETSKKTKDHSVGISIIRVATCCTGYCDDGVGFHD
ncbi:MAG: hypothetical protein FWD97_04845 [Defluviitaleaceae bacterium]|nr:hypothetical protein [Defluviitaleaceae bacterium]